MFDGQHVCGLLTYSNNYGFPLVPAGSGRLAGFAERGRRG
jgi:hypothetical protein